MRPKKPLDTPEKPKSHQAKKPKLHETNDSVDPHIGSGVGDLESAVKGGTATVKSLANKMATSQCHGSS